MANDGYDLSYRWIAFGVLAAIFVLIGVDVIADYGAGTTVGHMTIESTVMLLCLAGGAALWQEYRSARAQVTMLERDISTVGDEARHWRSETKALLDGLAVAIDGQFGRWHLTAAEREISFCLLGGLSHKEIAQARSTSERTVREQARSVYQKAGVTGRSALAAFFLEDLLPRRDRCTT